METPLRDALAGCAVAAPHWILQGAHDSPAPPEEAALALTEMNTVDRQACTLVHGLGMSLGGAAFVLKLDPALLFWRLGQALRRTGDTERDAALEASVATLLRGEHPTVAAGLGPDEVSWQARDQVESFPEALRDRLEARLVRDEDETTQEQHRQGVGLGVLMLVGLVAMAFIAYGALLVRNPMLRGKDYIRLGEYTRARKALEEAGPSQETRMWTAIAWLAEGHFSKAMVEIEERGGGVTLGAFRPVDLPLDQLDQDPESAALLPRGVLLNGRPEFVLPAGLRGTIRIEGRDTLAPLEIPPSRPEVGFVSLEYPADWRPLPPGDHVWSIETPEGVRHRAAFTVVTAELRKDIGNHIYEKLSPNNVPRPARFFLRGHYFLRRGLYKKAGDQFAMLARRFRDKAYPREMLAEIATALRVDGALFLR